jgi:spermidine synthase
VLFALMGATSLACEVLWTRILVFYLGSSVYAYSLMLLLFLLGVALGSLAVGAVRRRLPPLRALAAVELALALWAVAQIPLFGRLNAMLTAIAGAVAPRDFGDVATVQLLAVGAVIVVPTFLMGVSFPLAVDALGGRRTPRDASLVYGANTLGSVAGSLLAGFALIPLLGTQRSLLLAGGVNLALAALFAGRTRPSERGVLTAFAIAAPLGWTLLAPLFPPDRVILAAGMFRDDEPGALVHFHEDASASVTIRRLRERAGPYLSLELNGVNVAGTSPDLYAIQKMQGHLPLLLAADPRQVVHIGFGSGGTAHAVSRHPVDEILIVEISRSVIAASDRYFRDINHGVLDDPRVRVEINDGRNFLLATERAFDAVLSDSIHPRYAGNGSLYSEEYFRLARERLAPGGVVSMWLPMYSLTPRNFAMILAAFRAAFPHYAVWYEPSALNPFTVVTGKLDPVPWTFERLRAAFTDPRVAQELRDIGIRGPADLVACHLGGPAELDSWLDQVPTHSDELPAVEYESGALLHGNHTWLATFAKLLSLRPAAPPPEYLAALPPAEGRRAAALWGPRGKLLARHRDAIASQLRRRGGS